jgi:hypothetical protein
VPVEFSGPKVQNDVMSSVHSSKGKLSITGTSFPHRP